MKTQKKIGGREAENIHTLAEKAEDRINALLAYEEGAHSSKVYSMY